MKLIQGMEIPGESDFKGTGSCKKIYLKQNITITCMSIQVEAL